MEFIYKLADNILELLQSGKYERYVCDLMNLSKEVFPCTYHRVEVQSNGESDFADTCGRKYDAKLPFTTEQMKLLTSGKGHGPLVSEWIQKLQEEMAEYDLPSLRNESLDVTETKLYKIMKERIEKDKADENIIFFFPFPLALSVRGSFALQGACDLFGLIYEKLEGEDKIDLLGRSIYLIYPSNEENCFEIRNLGVNSREWVEYDELEKYFTYELLEEE